MYVFVLAYVVIFHQFLFLVHIEIGLGILAFSPARVGDIVVFPNLGARYMYEASPVGIGVVFATNFIAIHSQS